MDQHQQPQGNFVMNLNYRRKSSKDAPPITGRISAPEAPDMEFSFSAFAHTDEQGTAYWIGPVDMNRSIRQALNTQNEPGTHFIAIRENSFKVFPEFPDGKPNPAYAALSKDEQQKEDSKPSYWATWSRAKDQPQIRAAAWEREPTRYGPWASGNTQYPLTKEQADALKAGPAELQTPKEPEAPKPARTRASTQTASR